jgi:hypothetical protein
MLPDSVEIKIYPCEPTAIEAYDSATGLKMDTLHIHTGLTSTIKIRVKWGICSNNEWIEGTGGWELFPDPDILESRNPIPAKGTEAGMWHYDPINPGKAYLVVSKQGETGPVSDTVVFIIDREPPTRIALSNPGDVVAGVPFQVVIKLYNSDGLVPGKWCYPGDNPARAIYQEKLGVAGRPYPQVAVDGIQDTLNTRPSILQTYAECFNDGADTIDIALFYAPYDPDSLNRIYGNLGGLQDSTPPFRVLPGPLFQIQIETQRRHIVDTTLYAANNDFVILEASGYDEFWNYLGPQISNWTPNGTLHAINSPKDVRRIYYDATTSNVLYDQLGYIFAVTTNQSGSFNDSVHITLIGPVASVSTAITRDLNGNGYLDAIVLHFTKTVSFANYPLAAIQIIYAGVNPPVIFTVDSIRPGNTLSDSVVLYLHENPTIDPRTKRPVPQTAWKPVVSLNQAPAGGRIQLNIEPTDGAGPVVWRVDKYYIDVDDRTEDRVVVEFSEPVLDANLSTFPASNDPSMVFHDYRDTGGTEPKLLDLILDSINDFSKTQELTKFEFYMLNGKDLNALYFLNLKTEPGSVMVYDAAGNPPSAINQKVRVTVNDAYGRLTVAPNPGKPSTAGPIDITLKHDEKARQKILNEGQGILLTFKMVLPEKDSSNVKVSAILKIFDVAANLVQGAETGDNGDILTDKIRATAPGSLWDIDIYWSGKNSKGMKVAPGLYRAVLFLQYRHSGKVTVEKRYIANFGVSL